MLELHRVGWHLAKKIYYLQDMVGEAIPQKKSVSM
jgi:hypothetical protein